MKSCDIVIVEGFCILHSLELRSILHGLVWVETDGPTCLKRRVAAGSFPRGWQCVEDYFAQCVQPFQAGYRLSVFGQQEKIGVEGWSADLRVMQVDGVANLEGTCLEVSNAVDRWSAEARLS